MQRNIFAVLFLVSSIEACCQTKHDSIMNSILGNSVSIYEFGAPLASCETNFENLFKNWNSDNVTNACEYELIDFSFVETIDDTTRYNYYRNYFSGAEPVYGAIEFSSGVDIDGQEIYKLNIVPGYIHRELYDQRGLPEEGKKIMSKELIEKCQELLSHEFNIDTMDIKQYFYEKTKTDTIRRFGAAVNDYSTSKAHRAFNIFSTDSISNDYVDIFVKRKKRFDDLDLVEKRALLLEKLLIERITNQVVFNSLVHLGDKVYIVRFRYNGAMYSCYVICNPETKKVVMDTFFKNIDLPTKK